MSGDVREIMGGGGKREREREREHISARRLFPESTQKRNHRKDEQLNKQGLLLPTMGCTLAHHENTRGKRRQAGSDLGVSPSWILKSKNDLSVEQKRNDVGARLIQLRFCVGRARKRRTKERKRD